MEDGGGGGVGNLEGFFFFLSFFVRVFIFFLFPWGGVLAVTIG